MSWGEGGVFYASLSSVARRYLGGISAISRRYLGVFYASLSFVACDTLEVEAGKVDSVRNEGWNAFRSVVVCCGMCLRAGGGKVEVDRAAHRDQQRERSGPCEKSYQ